MREKASSDPVLFAMDSHRWTASMASSSGSGGADGRADGGGSDVYRMPATRRVQPRGSSKFVLFLPLLLCEAARGFLFSPGAGSGGISSVDGARRALQHRPVTPRTTLYGRPPSRSVHCMVNGGDGNEPQNAELSDSSAGDSGDEQSDSTTADGEESGDDEVPERPTFVYPSREELLREFPNAPEAPTRPPLEMKDFRQEDLISGNIDITYGGKPAARTAIEEYERIERERIHLSTAARVLNYDAEAQQRKLKAAVTVANEEPEDARRVVHTWHPFPNYGPPAVYKWDRNPQLVTFSGLEVLYNFVEPIGLILREALGRAWNWEVRLPGPDFFEKNYKRVYEEAADNLPVFGYYHNLTTQEWWYHVLCEAYLTTTLDFDLDENLVFEKIDDIFDELYFEIMVGPEAYELMPDVSVVLNRLANWRDENNGPKLAVITNEDERTHLILENLGILPYFDFVLTSREMGVEKPYEDAFSKAREMAGVDDPAKAIHVGMNYEEDIVGACEQGWEAACIKPKQSDWEAEDEKYEYHRLLQFEDLLYGFGLPKLQKTTMRRRRGQWWGDPVEDADGWWGEPTLGCNQL